MSKVITLKYSGKGCDKMLWKNESYVRPLKIYFTFVTVVLHIRVPNYFRAKGPFEVNE